MDTLSISRSQAKLLVWLVEKAPSSFFADMLPEKESELYELYNTLHLFADKNANS